MSKRLEILKQSLIKKECLFNQKIESHIADVKSANGQPLNDKRNGQTTLSRWDKQNNALRNLKKSIEKTKDAIEREEYKVLNTETTKSELPQEIQALINTGQLKQWRKHPHIMFVEGVDKARIIWYSKNNIIAHKFTSEIKDQEQWSIFVKIFNPLAKKLTPTTP